MAVENVVTENVIIVGSGPAGLTAATYLARAGLKPLVFAGEKAGGQLMLTTTIENFPGFPNGILGQQLMADMRQQAEKFGAVMQDDNVTKVDFSQKPFKVGVGETQHQARAILIATGAESVWLNVPGEKEFIGRGVSICAVCDGAFFRKKAVCVIGGGDSAMEEALTLTNFADSVTMIHRRDSFRACKLMQERVLKHPKIKVVWNSVVTEITGDQKVTAVVVENTQTHEKQTLSMDGVFVAIGHTPTTTLFKDALQLDKKGFIITRFVLGEESLKLAQSGLGFTTMTSVDGVFAAGDVVDFRYKQASSSAGFGTMAALDIEKWLAENTENLREKET